MNHSAPAVCQPTHLQDEREATAHAEVQKRRSVPRPKDDRAPLRSAVRGIVPRDTCRNSFWKRSRGRAFHAIVSVMAVKILPSSAQRCGRRSTALPLRNRTSVQPLCHSPQPMVPTITNGRCGLSDHRGSGAAAYAGTAARVRWRAS